MCRGVGPAKVALLVGAVFFSCILAVAIWWWWPNRDMMTRAALDGDIFTVRLCLSFGVDPNEPPGRGWLSMGPTPLVAAARGGHVQIVRLLLAHGAGPNTPERWGWNFDGDGQTPLTAAAQNGNAEIVKLLLAKGADINLHDSGNLKHQTPLALAAIHGHYEVCRVMLEAGADPNVRSYPLLHGDPGNWTPLDSALQAQNDLVQLLKHYGAEEGARSKKGSSESDE
jgi:ankyrin repeat protein